VVFYITATIYAFGTIFYGLFASGEIQRWASPKDLEVEVTANTSYETGQGNSQQ